MKKHFVTFMSPGTFLSEESTKDIDYWNVEKAQQMAKKVKERHGAVPYGFYFTTRERDNEDFDSKQTARSNMYYLGGEVLTLEQIKAKNDADDSILISNMECNDWNRVVINTNSWKITRPLIDGDVVL